MQTTLDSRADLLLDQLPLTSFVFRLDPYGVFIQARRPPDPSRLWIPAEEFPGKTIEQVLPASLAEPRRWYFDRAVMSREPQLYYYPHPNDPEVSMGCSIVPILASDVVVEVLVEVFDVVISRIPASRVIKPQESDG